MIWLPGAVLTAPAMLLAGTAASVHCAAMCGALSAHQTRAASGGLPLPAALAWLHGGRVLGYGLLGAATGTVGQALLTHLPSPEYGRLIQSGASLVLVAIGVRLLRKRPRTPSCCQGAMARKPGAGRLALLLRGLAWAAVPCGLLYSVLLLSALSGNGFDGGLLAAAFALGGTPLLAAIGWRSARR
ncbi:MAG: sulfite exporter TauE/SafE family protein, partial [Nevskia sp.]|nr:sulfite exporter TauE/SafE family protein [Nevskia sp.]